MPPEPTLVEAVGLVLEHGLVLSTFQISAGEGGAYRDRGRRENRRAVFDRAKR